MKTQVIIAAAGSGERLNASMIKSLVLLKGKPLFLFSLGTFNKIFSVDSMILVVSEKHQWEFEHTLKQYPLEKVTRVVAGGLTRAQSVAHGLKALDKDTDCVIIHDAARPFVTMELVEKTIKGCQKHRAVITAVPVKPTIKKVDAKTMTVKETLDRKTLWEVQTPQAFHKNTILKAHRQYKGEEPTDDAMMVEKLGVPVKVVEGDYKNIKITTAEDLLLAETFLNESLRG